MSKISLSRRGLITAAIAIPVVTSALQAKASAKPVIAGPDPVMDWKESSIFSDICEGWDTLRTHWFRAPLGSIRQHGAIPSMAGSVLCAGLTRARDGMHERRDGPDGLFCLSCL